MHQTEIYNKFVKGEELQICASMDNVVAKKYIDARKHLYIHLISREQANGEESEV
jgi:hypothetical protein